VGKQGQNRYDRLDVINKIEQTKIIFRVISLFTTKKIDKIDQTKLNFYKNRVVTTNFKIE
jgi:hypothetical protein